MDLHPLFQKVRALGMSVDTTEEREIRHRVTAAEQRLLRGAHITPEMMDLLRSATRRDEEGHLGEWRGTIPQQQVQAPYEVCGRHLRDDQRFAFGGWFVLRRCTIESEAVVADDRGDDRLGVAIRGGIGVPRRGTFPLTAMEPNVHLRYNRSTPDGAHQQRQLETLWRSLTSGVEERPRRQGEGGQDMEGELEEPEEFWCIYTGWPLDNSVGESEENDARVPAPCARGGFVRTRCMLDRVEHLAREHASSSPCVACRSTWPGGKRPPHSAELARGLSMNGHEGRWAGVRGALLQFTARVQRHISGPESVSHTITGIYGTFELMCYVTMEGAQPLRSCSLFRDSLDLSQGAYLDFPRPRA